MTREDEQSGVQQFEAWLMQELTKMAEHKQEAIDEMAWGDVYEWDLRISDYESVLYYLRQYTKHEGSHDTG